VKLTAICFALCLLSQHSYSQCADGEVALTMNIYTDSWPYESYWEIVPGTNGCGDGTIAWGDNQEAVGCSGGGEQNAYGTATTYPGNALVQVEAICLTEGELYTLHFVDDWGDGGLYFEMFTDGNFSGFYAGGGIGNTWTFEAGNSYLGIHDSPCNAIEVVPGINTAVEFDNIDCYTQISEVQPPQGNCYVSGFWCTDEVTRTAWAKFIVPTDGAYEISTAHIGTYINTQIAVWVSDTCDMSTFQYVSGNDDILDEIDELPCAADPPSCVDRASAAYLNVMSTYPACCITGWDGACQDLYDSFSTTCNGEIQQCEYILEAYDSYGDGWNGCSVIVTLDGVETSYTLNEGSYTSWPIPIMEGGEISIEFVAADYPEEVYVALRNADGVPLLSVQAITVDPLLYDNATSCHGIVYGNPQASRCYTNCLAAGSTCYIQVDGYDNQFGQILLTVKPYNEAVHAEAITVDLVCPAGVGEAPAGAIVPNLIGWGVNYHSEWIGPDDFTSGEMFLLDLSPGEYVLNANDDCGNSFNEAYTVDGPAPFDLVAITSPSCANENHGSAAFTASGGTEPYIFTWFYENGDEHSEPVQEDLFPGMYYLYLVDANGCDIGLPAEVQELSLPVFSLGEDFTTCNDFIILLQSAVEGAHEWSDGSAANYLELTDDGFDLGEHEVSLTVMNADGCAYSDTIAFEVIECVKVEEDLAAQIHIYPNPASDMLVIDHGTFSNGEYMIYDAYGRLLYAAKINAALIQFDTSMLVDGCYVARFISGDDVYEKKIIVRH